MLERLLKDLVNDSPRANFEKLKDRLAGKAAPAVNLSENKVLDDLMALPCLADLLVFALSRLEGGRIVLCGDAARYAGVAERLQKLGRAVEFHTRTWEQISPELAPNPTDVMLLCLLPVTEAEWTRVATLKKQLAGRLVLLTEVLLPFTRVSILHEKLYYGLKDINRLFRYYLGEDYFGPLQKLDALFPLRGKSVIEFGPLDACQTAGLVHLGADRVTCIEARAENVAKTEAAAAVFGWKNIKLILDDFHNADGTKYGRFDLAFAHGVYYHSVAPFVFLENCLTLSDHVFMGGLCGTDIMPQVPWQEIEHEGRKYRAKKYREGSNATAGVNRNGWFFHADDLARFFTERGWGVEIISDEITTVTAGRYLRFLATRGAA